METEEIRYPQPSDIHTGVVVSVLADWSPSGVNTYEGCVMNVCQESGTLVIEWWNEVKDRWQELDISFSEIVRIVYEDN